MNLFFTDQVPDNFIILNPEESRHCVRVLRMKKGDQAMVTDGHGKLYSCVIRNDDAHACRMEIIGTPETTDRKSFHLHIAIAPTKNADRFEWFLEKATEIGIDEITPVFCAHSERKKLNPEHGKKVILSALKQSLKTVLPELNSSRSFKDLVTGDVPGMKFIATCETGKEETLDSQYRKGSDVTVLIGPEGDFDPEEVQSAREAGWIPVSLGKSRLRTETAGIIACHIINLINEQ
jgi:16S rRNA (uracil1498-N3)-methyltransferase